MTGMIPYVLVAAIIRYVIRCYAIIRYVIRCNATIRVLFAVMLLFVMLFAVMLLFVMLFAVMLLFECYSLNCARYCETCYYLISMYDRHDTICVGCC
jgi:hypothetical protein